MLKTSQLLTTAALVVLFFGVTSGQTTGFNFQGSLKDGSAPANGNYDFEFALFDAISGGTQLGSTLSRNAVAVSNGIFSVNLDFGSQFPGGNRFLEIRVKLSGGPSITTLSPRQQVNSSPYAQKSLSSDTATSAVSAVNATNANNAATAGNVTGIVAVANGGTGSATQNFVDLSSTQTNIAGNKTFTGNVTVSGTLTATLGQVGDTVYNTAGVTITPASGNTVVPGLTKTITVPVGYSAFVTSSGGVQTSSSLAAGFSVVDIFLTVDGSIVPNGGYRRVNVLNNTGITSNIGYWTIAQSVSLSPGTHTIEVAARGVGSGSNATVGGNNTSVLQGDLTVILIKN